MSRKQLHETMRPALIAKYQLIDDDVPGCFGTKPQGNDSAYYQGCPRCDYGDKCYDATQDVHAARPKDYYKKANERYCVKKDNRGPYVHDARTGYDDSMSPAEIVKLLNKYEDLKKKEKK